MNGIVVEVLSRIDKNNNKKTFHIVKYQDGRWPSADSTIAFEFFWDDDDITLGDEVELSITKRQNKSESLKNRP